MKLWLWALIVILTIYAPSELTRVIMTHNIHGAMVAAESLIFTSPRMYYGLAGKFIFEIGFIWVFYLFGLGVVAHIISKVEIRR